MVSLHSGSTQEERSRDGQRGSSLIELMVVTVACVLVVGAALSMTTHQARQRKADQEVRLAMLACRNSLEELRSLPVPDLPTINGVGFDVPGKNGNPGGLTPVPGDKDGLPGEFRVVVDKTTGGKTLYRVTASVTWTGTSRTQTFQLQTMMGGRR